jgi:hypothetical protein
MTHHVQNATPPVEGRSSPHGNPDLGRNRGRVRVLPLAPRCWLKLSGSGAIWATAMFLFLVIVSAWLGAANWETSATYVDADGTTLSVRHTFASGDHPFHIERAHETLTAVSEGRPIRWFAQHIAGYPAEFYPPGGSMLVVSLHLVTLGTVPIETAYKLVVIASLWVVPYAFLLLVRRARLPVGLALVATVMHVMLPGNWLGGGPFEVLSAGLWANALAQSLPLLVLMWSLEYARERSSRALVLASITASVAIYINPRASIGVGIALLVALLISIPAAARAEDWRNAARVIFVGTIAVLLSGSLLVPLRANQHQYEFAHYNEFEYFGHMFVIYTEMLPVEVILLAVVGSVLTLASRRFHMRAIALYGVMSWITIITFGWFLRDVDVLRQLEGPRLMPLVRAPTIFLAAFALHEGATWILRRRALHRRVAPALLALGIAVLALLSPVTTIDAEQRGLIRPTTTHASFFDPVMRSVSVVNTNAGSNDRLLVLGNPGAAHTSFWLPALTGRTTLHDSWIWYWRVPGYADRTQLADTQSALDLEFLREHGLSFVIIDRGWTDLTTAALQMPHLRFLDDGEPEGYMVFVADADPERPAVVTANGTPVQRMEWTSRLLTIDVSSLDASTLHVRMNAYPTWEARIDGRRVPWKATDDGYIEVSIPVGASVVTLEHRDTGAHWFGRFTSLSGAIALAGGVIWQRRSRRDMSPR